MLELYCSKANRKLRLLKRITEKGAFEESWKGLASSLFYQIKSLSSKTETAYRDLEIEAYMNKAVTDSDAIAKHTIKLTNTADDYLSAYENIISFSEPYIINGNRAGANVSIVNMDEILKKHYDSFLGEVLILEAPLGIIEHSRFKTGLVLGRDE